MATVLSFFYFTNDPKQAEAGWWNDSWQYRKSVTVTNNTSTENNVYINLKMDSHSFYIFSLQKIRRSQITSI